MGQVAIAINGRRYNVNCDDGEEDRLRLLAAGLDRRVRALAASVGQVGENRLLLLTCLLLEDELAEAGRGAAAVAAVGLAAGGNAGGDAEAGRAAVADVAIDGDIDRLAERIEAVAAQLKHP